MEPEEPTGASGYWYDDASLASVLGALREFRRSDQEMRRRVSAGMDMNITDLQALQIVIAAEKAGEFATPRALSERLNISTASTTKLIDRLEASSHLVRSAHPTDRRSIVLRPTEHAHSEVRERLSVMHEQMAAIARSVPPEARGSLVDFLHSMARLLDEQEVASPGRR